MRHYEYELNSFRYLNSCMIISFSYNSNVNWYNFFACRQKCIHNIPQGLQLQRLQLRREKS